MANQNNWTLLDPEMKEFMYYQLPPQLILDLRALSERTKIFL